MALTAQQQAIQNQINAFDSNTGTQILLSTLLQAINAGDVRQGYADSAAFPTDSAFIGMIGFDDFDSSLRYVGRDLVAHKIDSADIVVPAAVASAIPYGDYQGTAYGFSMSNPSEQLHKFAFASDAAGVEAAASPSTLQISPSPVYSNTLKFAAGGGGVAHGYLLGGQVSPPAQDPSKNDIRKYPYANGAVSDTTYSISSLGHRTHEEMVGNRTYVYMAGRFRNPGVTYNPYFGNTIDKFPDASNANSTDVGDTLNPIAQLSSQSSPTHGYISGGYETAPSPTFSPNGPFTDTIQKWSFSSDGNSTDVGNLTVARAWAGGTSSGETGYASGGRAPPLGGATNIIDKFPFASDDDATDVGDLTTPNQFMGGWSSRENSYVAYSTAVEKMPFASETSAARANGLYGNSNHDAHSQE